MAAPCYSRFYSRCKQFYRSFVYTITNTTNGRVYCGSGFYVKRFNAHKRLPPPRMREDAAAGHSFTLALVAQMASPTEARRQEAHIIRTRQLTGPAGYNVLPAHPAFTPQFWAIKKKGGFTKKKKN